MRLGLLIIGSELLQGKITDANTVWLGNFLRPLNLKVTLSMTVSDDKSMLSKALRTLFAEVDVVICSGGLGPTPDDVTKEALGEFFGKKIFPSAEARKISEGNYQRFERTLPDGHGYGYLPEGFLPLDNPAGFAPGLWFSESGKSLLAAPGVPKEFQTMLALHFPSRILPLFPAQKSLSLLNFRTWGVPEEKIFTELDPTLWKDLEEYGAVSSLPHVMGVDIGITLSDSTDEKIAAVKKIMRQSKVWSHVWSEGFTSLEEVIVREAKAKNLTIGFAESCTGGLCAHRLTNVAGSSEVFWGSIVSYHNSVKENLIDVKSETLKTHGAVSLPVAEEMALGAQKRLKTDLAIALTGIAGPGGGSVEKPVGTVCVGIASKNGVRSEKFVFKGDRETLKMRFSQIAFFKLLMELRN